MTLDSPDPRVDAADAARSEAIDRLELFQRWAENSRDVIAEVTLDGRILYVSRNVRAVLGYEPGKMIGTSIFAHVHPDDTGRARAQFTSPEGWVTCRYRHHDGSWRWLEASARDVVTSDGRTRVSVIARDVTGRKWAEDERSQLEAQLRRAQRFEVLGTLTSGIAHDFNNILTAIVAHTELARLDTEGQPSVQHSLEQVLAASQRAANLVRQIMSFSRQQQQERHPLALPEVVTEVLKLLRASLPVTIELRADIRDSSSLVYADPTQIHQVLMNLCTNAAHALPGRAGRIQITVDSLLVDATFRRAEPKLRAGRYVRMSVADNGVGMDALTLTRIFEPFFTTKNEGEGTGLGLSVVGRIVRDHDGAIHVSSRPEHGTLFELFFPRYNAAPLASEAKPEALVRGNGERILFVDDETALCAATERVLQKLNYHPIVFSTPREALEAFRGNPDAFDLVITDWIMPEMTGLELAAELAALRSNLPIIVMTGSTETMDRVEARGAEISGIITKPVTPIVLAAAVRHAVHRRSLDHLS